MQNVQSLFNSFSITGNLYLDGLIATTIFGMLKGWLDIIIDILKFMFEFVYIRMRYVIFKYLGSRIGGKELYKISYEPPSEIYYFLRKYVLTQKGDLVDQDIKRLYFKKFFEPYYWYHHDSDDSISDDIEIDFLGEGTIQSKKYNKTLAKEKLYFRYVCDGIEYIFQFYELDANYYRRMKAYYLPGNIGTKDDSESNKDSNKSPSQEYTTIWMEMVTFSGHTPSPKKRLEIIESFLNDRFNMDKLVYRTYQITIGVTIGDQIYNAVGRGVIRRKGCVSTDYADFKIINRFTEGVYNSYSNINETQISEKSALDMDVKQLHSGFKYYDQIKLVNQDTDKSNSAGGRLLVFRFIDTNYPFGSRETLFTFKDYLIFYDARNYFKIYIVTQGKKLAEQDVKEIIQHLIEISFSAKNTTTQNKSKNQVNVYKREQNQWNQYVLSKRSFDSIYLPKKLMGHIRNEFDGFIEIEKLYREYQIPYKKGILFYGPPGTGKTSLVKALAFEYQLPLYIIDVNDEEINDDSIVTILNGLGNNGLKLLLFEDIDTAFADKEKVRNETKLLVQQQTQNQNQKQNQKKSNKSTESNNSGGDSDNTVVQNSIIKKKFLTYSGLLNALDGVMSNQSGVITIMTTNYLERLGQAFLRPGRIDVKFELKECNSEQIEEMTRTFLEKRIKMSGKIFADDKVKVYPQTKLDKLIKEFADNLTDSYGSSKIKPCQLQFYLLRYIRKIDEIFDNYRELLVGDNPEDLSALDSPQNNTNHNENDKPEPKKNDHA